MSNKNNWQESRDKFHYYLLLPREALNIFGDHFYRKEIKDKTVETVQLPVMIYKKQQECEVAFKPIQPKKVIKEIKKRDENNEKKSNKAKLIEYQTFQPTKFNDKFNKFIIDPIDTDVPNSGINFYWNDEVCFIETFEPTINNSQQIFKTLMTEKAPYNFVLE